MKYLITIVLCLNNLVLVFGQEKTYVKVYAPVLSPMDTLELYIQPERIHYHFYNPAEIISAGNEGGYFNFEIELDCNQVWISLHLSYQNRTGLFSPDILEEYLLESGDSILVQLTPKKGLYQSVESGYDGGYPIITESWSAKFSGVGAEKYQIQQKIQLIGESGNREKVKQEFIEVYPENNFLILQKLEQESLDVLDNRKNQLSSEVYQLMEAQVKGKYGYEIGRFLEKGYFYFRKENTESEFRRLLELFFVKATNDLNLASEWDNHSPRYIDYLTQFVWLKYSDARRDNGYEEHWYYLGKELVKYSQVRDRVLANLLMINFSYRPDRVVLNDALQSIKLPYAHDRVRLLQNLLRGTEAYAFNLPDAQSVYHKLSDFEGKVVFMDFWFASCTPCRNYMLDVVGPVKEHFKDNPDVVFITVSIDNYQTFAKMVQKVEFLPQGGVHLYTDNQHNKHPIIQYYQIRGYPQPLLIGIDRKVLASKEQLRTKDGLIKELNIALSK